MIFYLSKDRLPLLITSQTLLLTTNFYLLVFQVTTGFFSPLVLIPLVHNEDN